MSTDPFGAAPPPNYDFYDTYEQDYKPEHRYALDIKALEDGPHEFEILSAQLVTANNGKPILECSLKVDGGLTIKHSWWHDSQDGFNAMCADLLILGFDADKWGRGGKPIREALPAAVARMPGLRFKGLKRTRVVEDKPMPGVPAKEKKTYHDLIIHGLVKTGRSTPAAPAPTQGFDETQPSPQARQPAAATAGASSW